MKKAAKRTRTFRLLPDLHHLRVTLSPENPEFEPIMLRPDHEEAATLVAEVVEVLGMDSPARRLSERRQRLEWRGACHSSPRAGTCGSVTPMSVSRVISAASAASLMPSVPAGRIGSTR